jgi:hypothetical protein
MASRPAYSSMTNALYARRIRMKKLNASGRKTCLNCKRLKEDLRKRLCTRCEDEQLTRFFAVIKKGVVFDEIHN